MEWAAHEMDGVELGDKRLNERLITLLDTLSARSQIVSQLLAVPGMKRKQPIDFLAIRK